MSCQNLGFWALSKNVFVLVLSKVEFLWFITFFLFLSKFGFCHCLGLEFFSILVVEFCHNYRFWISLQFRFFSLVFFINLIFLGLGIVTIWVNEFFFSLYQVWVYHNLSFWVLRLYEFEFRCYLIFVTIWVLFFSNLEFCHNLIVWVLLILHLFFSLTIFVFHIGHN